MSLADAIVEERSCCPDQRLWAEVRRPVNYHGRRTAPPVSSAISWLLLSSPLNCSGHRRRQNSLCRRPALFPSLTLVSQTTLAIKIGIVFPNRV